MRPTSATTSSTSSGFDSVVNTVPSVWAYAFARPRALTSVRS
ncbi:Uncharacterised protein [Mycobacteroides abscessus]|nr:Uncharacterised protein [Mycobacteroides abscessus]